MSNDYRKTEKNRRRNQQYDSHARPLRFSPPLRQTYRCLPQAYSYFWPRLLQEKNWFLITRIQWGMRFLFYFFPMKISKQTPSEWVIYFAFFPLNMYFTRISNFWKFKSYLNLKGSLVNWKFLKKWRK